MKQDRFLLGILVGIGILVLVAVGLFLTRQDTQEYRADDTPEGVVHNYALALYRGNHEKAYAYLADVENKPTYSEFRESFFNQYIDPSNVGLEIGEAKIDGDQAFVILHLNGELSCRWVRIKQQVVSKPKISNCQCKHSIS